MQIVHCSVLEYESPIQESRYLQIRVNFYSIPNVFIDLKLPISASFGSRTPVVPRLHGNERGLEFRIARGRTGRVTGKGRRPCILSQLSLRRSIPTVSLARELFTNATARLHSRLTVHARFFAFPLSPARPCRILSHDNRLCS